MTWMAAHVKSAFKAEEFSIKRTILWTLIFTDAFFLSCLLARLVRSALDKRCLNRYLTSLESRLNSSVPASFNS